MDSRQVGAVVECFTEDARLSANGGASTVEGRGGIQRYFAGAFTRPELGTGARSSHLLTNTRIAFTGADDADLVTLGLAVLAYPGSPTVRLRGLRYADRCQRVGGDWLIAERQHEALWQCEAPGSVV